MNILCFIDNLGSGGAQRQMVNLALLFQERGHDVNFLTYGKQEYFKDKLDKVLINVDYIDSNGPIDRIIKIRRYLRLGNQDVVISFLETPNFLACFSAIGGRRWKLITNELSAKNASFKSVRGRLFKWFERYSDEIVCNSLNAQRMWKEYCPKYNDKLLTIYNPILLPEGQCNYSARKDGRLHLVIAASYQYLKNMDGLIEAVNILKEEEKDTLRIDWYGRIEVTTDNTEAYERAKEKIVKYNLIKIISLHEETKDIIQKMDNSDFVCLLSKVEGLPNAICEGMTLGKPIIMTRVSDYNVLVDEENGFLCDSDNPVSIKEALQKAIQLSADEINQMGKNSKEKAEKLFDKEIIVQKWINLISDS